MPLPPLILIHGYPFDHSMWISVIAAMENKTKVIAPDLPGFGDNPAAFAEPSIDLMADAVAKLFEIHHINRAVVAGMSMGGYVALAFAQRHKARLAGLGLISTQSAADTPEVQQSRRIMIEKVRREGATAAAEAIIPKLFSETNQNDVELKLFPREGARKAGIAGICWALKAMAQRPDRTALLRTLPVPAAVIHGIDDKIIPAERARKMSSLIPDSKYFEISGGHASPLEAPQAIADALLDLLERAGNPQSAESRKRASGQPGIIISPTERGL